MYLHTQHVFTHTTCICTHVCTHYKYLFFLLLFSLLPPLSSVWWWLVGPGHVGLPLSCLLRGDAGKMQHFADELSPLYIKWGNDKEFLSGPDNVVHLSLLLSSTFALTSISVAFLALFATLLGLEISISPSTPLALGCDVCVCVCVCVCVRVCVCTCVCVWVCECDT